MNDTCTISSYLDLSFEERQRRREWNRSPLKDLFPRIPPSSLETILDICISKSFVYQLSQPKLWNSRRYTSIVVAHVRRSHTEYDNLLREEHVERFEARQRTAAQVWKVLREWCPWDDSNEVLERCFQATLLRPEERTVADWDPMDVDDESDFADDPMDLD
ncbi:hypothetical protein BAUCODRAFT_193954 [Baudoinia panamericana UAMH 10762]|uniref:DUF2293 domain-containing protein n=1 Tax=Baudoinia panamericana (strain UAMH 10762) TaxID=717646 RepID=M2NNI0_BAUPA|nr:uncharacterized protein BAUCODRAFT_193954 [Baudoinia panamericana UAMH 10762]EMD01055.1 hypothetical protein BAUCODRAFT_193954 [Baudoinia panamericana UAMH 10762]